MTPLGDKLRRLRSERGITLKEMAQALNVSSAYLSALEHGKRGKPTWFLL
ncbi:Transcriptional regulator, Xre family, partial [hydrothermal vent metagenome]